MPRLDRMLPWAPLLFGLRPDTLWSKPLFRFVSAWTVLPPLAILLALQWRHSPKRRCLGAAAGSLLLVPLAGALLPAALAGGSTRAWPGLSAGDAFMGIGGAGIGTAALSVGLAFRVDRQWAVTAVGLPAAVALVGLKIQVYPAISEVAGTREFVWSGMQRRSRILTGSHR